MELQQVPFVLADTYRHLERRLCQLKSVMLAVGVVGFFMWDNFKSGGGNPVPSAIHITVKGK